MEEQDCRLRPEDTRRRKGATAKEATAQSPRPSAARSAPRAYELQGLRPMHEATVARGSGRRRLRWGCGAATAGGWRRQRMRG